MSRYLRAPDSALFAFGGLGAIDPQTAANIDKINIELVNLLVEMQTRIATTLDVQTRGQLQTAVKTLNHIINGSLTRLIPKAKAGDTDAYKRLQRIAASTADGMRDILHILDTQTAENIRATVASIEKDINRLSEKAAAAASGGIANLLMGAFKGSPAVTVAVLGLGGYLVWRKLK